MLIAVPVWRAKAILIVAACLLTACAAPPPAPKASLLTDPQQVAAGTKIKRDDFKKLTEYTGANASPNNSLYVRAWRDDATGKTDYQIYFVSFYSSQWRFYNEAYDSNGNRLNFVSIDKRTDSCSGERGCYYQETVGIDVTREYLERNQDSGIRFKVSGKTGETVGFLPSAYVKGFLLSTAH